MGATEPVSSSRTVFRYRFDGKFPVSFSERVPTGSARSYHGRLALSKFSRCGLANAPGAQVGSNFIYFACTSWYQSLVEFVGRVRRVSERVGFVRRRLGRL